MYKHIILSDKSNDEIYALLDEYGIKHGPVVEEEVTCVYRTPVRSDLPENKRSTRSARLSARPKKSSQDVPKKARSSRFIPVWAQLVFFLIAAVFLYLVISNISNICWGVMINIDDYS
ncbi:uncharacterized protein LOC144014724 isoform X3 [Festucalex cinctus]